MAPALVLVAALLAAGCSHTTFVPVCSQHGGIREINGPDHVDDYFTRDVVCKDGITQRPEQIEGPDGKQRLMVPSER
ncbi:MAG: hypothetical protein JO195_04820 [Candidatus Eremiobacteraeota bacterium]|nr:hypothetical protein [Candidatus Eremiobacteraeota bacterium]MBV8596151.1 hypothetical protein [Candidatus Eremiobacteraeota bacterium]MBV8667788.1 hypothetical protein [Candidatus Eremiobacteraeota bacterium]